MMGRRDDARALFERVIGLRNDVSLLAEEYLTHEKRQIRNFPRRSVTSPVHARTHVRRRTAHARYADGGAPRSDRGSGRGDADDRIYP